MITRVEIDGFKSLRGFALDLEPFTALIGPNGAGKSNVLDALSLLARLASSDLAVALQGGPGRTLARGEGREQFSSLDEAVKQRGFGLLSTLSLAIEVLLLPRRPRGSAPGGLTPEPKYRRLRYEVCVELQWLSSGVERYALRAEKLVAMHDEDPWLDRHPELDRLVQRGDRRVLFSFERSTVQITDPLDGAAAQGPVHLQYVQQRAFLSEPGVWARSPHLFHVAKALREMQFAHLEPRLLREPSESTAPRMTSEGEDMARELAWLTTVVPSDEQTATDADRRPGAFGRIQARLVALIPGVRRVNVGPSGDRILVEVELTDGQRFSSRVLSDGTLRVLGLLTLIETTAPGVLLAIEEPENGVHPSRARALLDILRQTAAMAPDEQDVPPVQIVITSHSPAVLAALMDRPHEIVFIDMVREGVGPRRSRVRTIAAADAPDRGERTVSRREIERVLATAMVPPEDGGGP